eukprot:523373-Hanusia_phi.AAC.2
MIVPSRYSAKLTAQPVSNPSYLHTRPPLLRSSSRPSNTFSHAVEIVAQSKGKKRREAEQQDLPSRCQKQGRQGKPSEVIQEARKAQGGEEKRGERTRAKRAEDR